jgi:hypothetical protein
METVTENQVLTEEELNSLKQIQNQTQALVMELGEIEMIKLQIEARYQNAKEFLAEVSNLERDFTKSVFEKYGKVNIDPKTGEITKLD